MLMSMSELGSRFAFGSRSRSWISEIMLEMYMSLVGVENEQTVLGVFVGVSRVDDCGGIGGDCRGGDGCGCGRGWGWGWVAVLISF